MKYNYQICEEMGACGSYRNMHTQFWSENLKEEIKGDLGIDGM